MNKPNKNQTYRKVFIPKANGYIYVEYLNKGEEQGRAKIYDSNWNYLDYIPTEEMTKKEYQNIILEMQNAKDMDDFILNCLFWNRFDSSYTIFETIDSVYDNDYVGYDDYDDCKEAIDELTHDYDTLTEKELCNKYDVNRVGNWYMICND